MTLRSPIRTTIYGGGGISALVPYKWDCSVNGRTFMFEDKYFGTAQFTRSSIPLLRPPTETGTISEQSLNPGDGIRAKIESWHKGAGQQYLDRDASDPYRFRSSKGVNPWNRWQLSLLPDTDRKVSSSNTNLTLLPAGSRLYLTNDQTLSFTTDPTADTPSFTTVTGSPASAITGIASDGYTVWTAFGSNGIYDTNTGATAAASRTTGTVGGPLGYVKGRLMAANTNSIYNVTSLSGAAAALPSALYTHPNTEFRWVGFAEGQSVIYAAGYAGDKSLIYKTTIKADGTALDVPTVAGELPDGQIIRAIGSYLGVVLIGTDDGVWVGAQDSSGNLTVNQVIEGIGSVRCFEGQGDFVWFGWTNYDATSTGLGRMDLTTDTKGASVVTPGYASDLMATAQGTVLSCVTFGERRYFTVSGNGVWGEETTKVASGTINSGWITHRMADNKVAVSSGVVHDPLNGEITLYLTTDAVTYRELATSAIEDSTSLTIGAGSVVSEKFELRHVLERDASDTTAGPVMTRATLESNPAPGRGERFTVALRFREQLDVNGGDEEFDCGGSYRALVDLESAGAPVVYQDVLGSETVTLDDHDFLIEGHTPERDGFRGTYLLTMRRARRRTT